MSSNKLPEVWLRGPLEGIPALLQPVAHALLQAQEELHVLLHDFPETLLWEQPAGVASPGFHLQHMTGVLDRLFTYAAGQMLSPQQLEYLAQEGQPAARTSLSRLLAALDDQLALSITRLKETNPDTLTAVRGVGRKQTPSTVLGLLFHAAEHTMRHTGQLLVTVQVVKAK
ncbi:DinB family protein [Paraflavitalea soli]|uniref:DinB family protein n=2 Tax=Paraflavitalea soli TaxID=2315862 RepID=A0A3B7MWE2_9BACT|nr:DinB family protein [Paraflavitalea soli]